MSGKLALAIAVSLDRLRHHSVAQLLAPKYAVFEDSVKRRPVGVPLTLGDIGNIFVLPDIISVTFNELVVAQKYLALYIQPGSILPNPPLHELPVSYFRLVS